MRIIIVLQKGILILRVWYLIPLLIRFHRCILSRVRILLCGTAMGRRVILIEITAVFLWKLLEFHTLTWSLLALCELLSVTNRLYALESGVFMFNWCCWADIPSRSKRANFHYYRRGFLQCFWSSTVLYFQPPVDNTHQGYNFKI